MPQLIFPIQDFSNTKVFTQKQKDLIALLKSGKGFQNPIANLCTTLILALNTISANAASIYISDGLVPPDGPNNTLAAEQSIIIGGCSSASVALSNYKTHLDRLSGKTLPQASTNPYPNLVTLNAIATSYNILKYQMEGIQIENYSYVFGTLLGTGFDYLQDLNIKLSNLTGGFSAISVDAGTDTNFNALSSLLTTISTVLNGFITSDRARYTTALQYITETTTYLGLIQSSENNINTNKLITGLIGSNILVNLFKT